MSRDYSTISPSAKMLLYMKGLTAIPYARQAAQIVFADDNYDTGLSGREITFLFGVLHFEDRYWSIDQLLRDTGITNILELSSGFSFRGLAMAAQAPVHYIDTDLPDMITQKQQLLAELRGSEPLAGTLEVTPLNALDAQAFEAMVSRFPPGPVAIVNEGLLMYLGMAEKEQLCRTIHRVLKERGGCWITADAYIRRGTAEDRRRVYSDERAAKFFEQHNVHENMFDSFDDARAFFDRMGFTVAAEATTDPSKLTVWPTIMQKVTPERMADMAKIGRMQATWRLVVK